MPDAIMLPATSDVLVHKPIFCFGGCCSGMDTVVLVVNIAGRYGIMGIDKREELLYKIQEFTPYYITFTVNCSVTCGVKIYVDYNLNLLVIVFGYPYPF